MELSGKIKVLKIYAGESDRFEGTAIYDAIVREARTLGLAGATVYRGIMSFGASHSIHTIRNFALSADLPIVIEIVDEEAKIESFIPVVNELLNKSTKGGMVLTHEVEVHRYEKGEKYK